jgi:predicted GIY-YIG superfamily endonuclease
MFKTLKEARRREIEIKGWRRDKKINLIKFAKAVSSMSTRAQLKTR